MDPKLQCPRDGAPLTGRMVAGKLLPFRLDECAKCGGTWFDRGELRKVTKDAEIEHLLREIERPLSADLEPRDVAILAWIAPATFTKLQHETHRDPFR